MAASASGEVSFAGSIPARVKMCGMRNPLPPSGRGFRYCGPMTTKSDATPDAGDADPWEGFTPDQFTDSVADKVFARMTAAQDTDDSGDSDGGDPPAKPEKAPASTSKMGGILDWWNGNR